MQTETPSRSRHSKSRSTRWIMRSLLSLAVAFTIAASMASTTGQAHAAGGYLTTYNFCPYSQPYQHVTVFGTVYCSAYP